jgi:hypothetical protein
MTAQTYAMVDVLMTKLSENEAFENKDRNSFISFLAESHATYIDGESLFTPLTTLIYVQSEVLEIDPYQFLVEAQENLARFGYKCDTCEDVSDAKDVLDQEIFKFKAKRPLRWIIIKFLEQTTPNEQVTHNIFDISQFVIHISNNNNRKELEIFDEAELAFENKSFTIVADSFDWDKLQNQMDTMIGIETCGLNLKFLNSEVWHTIFNEIPIAKIVEQIIKWNTRVKLTLHPTHIPMFLLTSQTIENPSLRDVMYVIYPKDQRYIWNIYWEKLSTSQQRFAKPLIKDNVTNFHDGTPINMLTTESVFEQKFITGINDSLSNIPIFMPLTCVDIVNSEMEQNLNEFIKTDTDHIVFLFPLKTEQQPLGACYDRNALYRAPIFYECINENSLDPVTSVRLASSYFRLDIREFPIFISQDNFAYLLDSENQFFIVTETPTRLDFTVSKLVQDGVSNLVSADHCQTGSDKTLSVVIGLNADTIENAVELAEGGNKWRKRYPTHVDEE